MVVYGLYRLTNTKNTDKNAPDTIKIWITEGTTKDFSALIEGFKKYAPQYKKTDIIIERQTNDSDRYRTLLLSSITDDNGPDIFMLKSWEDAILENKIADIPSNAIDISNFEKNYDNIFMDLLVTDKEDSKKRFLRWVPLGYETLWIFYNKSLLREAPKTWNDVELLYRQFPQGKYVSNLWLGQSFVPNIIDILPIWLMKNWKNSYQSISDESQLVEMYLGYSTLWPSRSSSDDTTIDSNTNNTLWSQKTQMLSDRTNTFDMFMRGDIWFVVGYPSTVLELEKSTKRVKSDITDIILTHTSPQFSTKSQVNIARYAYVGISKKTKNPLASAKFLEYLMTEDAQRELLKIYPYFLPAQVSFYNTIESIRLSSTLSRAKLANFLPKIGSKTRWYNYGLKSRYTRYFREAIDMKNGINIDETLSVLQRSISCEISLSIDGKNDNWKCKNE